MTHLAENSHSKRVGGGNRQAAGMGYAKSRRADTLLRDSRERRNAAPIESPKLDHARPSSHVAVKRRESCYLRPRQPPDGGLHDQSTAAIVRTVPRQNVMHDTRYSNIIRARDEQTAVIPNVLGIATPSGHRFDAVKPYHKGQQRDILARSVELDAVEMDLEDMISTLFRRDISAS